MKSFMNALRTYLLKVLRSPEVIIKVEESIKYLVHESPRLVLIDREFEPLDWEKLRGMFGDNHVFFEWIAKRIENLENEFTKAPRTPDGDRDRLCIGERLAELRQVFHVSDHAARKLEILLASHGEKTAKKGLNNNGK